MLLSFRFANHRSFRDEQQLNLTPIYGSEESTAVDARLEAVPVVGIFGANASGKSNVISALEYAVAMIGRSDRESEPGLPPRRQPFRLRPNFKTSPSSYAVDLTVGGIRHTYGFILNDQQILEEWLYSYPLQRKRIVFERSGQDFNWGEESGRSSAKRISEIVSRTSLFLSTTARFNLAEANADDSTAESLHGTYTTLRQKTSVPQTTIETFLGYEQHYYGLLEDPLKRKRIVNLLRAADVGLSDVRVRPDGYWVGGSFIPGDDPNIEELVYQSERSALVTRSEVSFLHNGEHGTAALGIGEESSGTLRLVEVAASAISVLDDGGLMLIDEIDASLHPLLTAALIRLFQSPETNRNNAQIIFTTHDAALLGSIDGDDVLRRDQVWFTDKGDDGASELFPLSEFKPRRQGENRQKRYLNGSYGAIPELSMRLFERAVSTRADADGE